MPLTLIHLNDARTTKNPSFSNENFSAPELEKLFEHLMQNTLLQSLDLSHHTSGYILSFYLTNLLEKSTTLTSLSLHDCELNGDTINSLLAAISQSPSVTNVSLENNPLDALTLIRLEEFKQQYPRIQLHFSSNLSSVPEDLSTFRHNIPFR